MEMAIDDTEMVQTAYYRRQTNITTTISGIDRTDRPYIHPNPATEAINVVLPQNENLLKVQLFDPAGREVMSVLPLSDRIWIPLHALPSGTYVIKCSGESGSAFFDRVIVQ